MTEQKSVGESVAVPDTTEVFKAIGEPFPLFKNQPFREQIRIPRFQLLLAAFVVLFAGGICYWVGQHLWSLGLVATFMLLYSLSILWGMWKSGEMRSEGPLASLILRTPAEKALIEKLCKIDVSNLNVARRRVKTQQECINIRSKAVAAVPEILIAGGILFTAADSLGMIQGIPVPNSMHLIVKGGFALALACLGFSMKYADFLTNLHLAALREIEFYLEIAAEVSSAKKE